MLQISAEGVPESRKKNQAAESAPRFRPFLWPGRFVIIVALLVAPWCLGSVHAWPRFLLHAMGLLALSFWWLDVGLSQKRRIAIPFVAIPIVIGALLSLLQIVPLPESVAEIIAPEQKRIYEEFGSTVVLGDDQASPVPVKLSVDPDRTLEYLGLLLVGLNFFLASAHFFQSRQAAIWLLASVTFNGVALSFAGMVQAAIGDGKILGLVEPQFVSRPFASFVNRNNAGGYLLMCIGAAFALCYLMFAQRESGRRPRAIVTHELPPWSRLWMHTLLFISELNAKKLSVLIAVFIIAAALFLALSRGAFVAFIIASLTTFWCFGIARKPENTVTLLVATVGVVFFVVGWLTIGQQLLDRFNQHSAENIVTQEARFQNWKETSPAVLDYGLLGSGTGSYHSVHRLYRDDTEKVIFEHAENQYFQTAVENGWLGFLLLLLAIGTAWASASFVLNRGTSSTTIAVGLMGIFVLASQAVCAFFDFGMMIPSNLVLMASLCGIVSAQAHALGGRLKKKNIFQRGANKFLVQLFLFILLLSSCWHALSAWRLIEIETITAENPIRDFSPAVNQDETQKEFEETSQLIRATRSAKAYLHRARLTLHQYRLKRYPIDKQEFEKRISLYQAALANKKRFAAQLVEKKITTEANAPMVLDALVALVSQDASPQELDQKIVELTKLSDDQLSQFKLDLIKIREDVITEITFNQFLRAITSKAGAEYKELHDRLLIDGVEAVEPVQSFVWSMSNPRSFHLWLHQLEAEDPILHSRTLASFAVQGEIKDARQDLLQSIQRSPLDPAAHLLLLQLQAGTDSKEVEHEMAERMIALAPKNSEARNYAGLFALQAGQPHQACEHWHEYLSLDPRPRRLRGIMNRIRNRMDIESIYRELIPKTEPMLMYLFATEEVRGKDNAAFRDRVLREAYDVLIEEASRDFEPLFLKGRIQKRLGEDDAALSSLLEAQRKKRGNRELIFELAQLQYRMNLLNDAYHNAEFLSRKHPENNHYRRLLKQINEKRIQK